MKITIDKPGTGQVPATYEPADGAGHLIVLSHGIFVTRSENGRFDRLADKLLKLGIASVRPDLAGHGESQVASRQTTVSSMALDLEDVINWAARTHNEVSVIASSFSGALFSLIQAYGLLPSLRGIVMLNPVLDFTNVFVRAEKPEMSETFSDERQLKAKTSGHFWPTGDFEMSRDFLLDLAAMDVERAYLKLQQRHLVIHGTSDELVSYERTKEIVTGNAAATFKSIADGVHAFTQSGHEAEAMDIAVDWLR